MSVVHIRDLMVATKEQLKNYGTVPNITLCGLHDPKMNTLTFGEPGHVLRRQVDHPCERCINRWNSEAQSDSKWKKTYNDFRKIIQKMLSGGYNRR